MSYLRDNKVWEEEEDLNWDVIEISKVDDKIIGYLLDNLKLGSYHRFSRGEKKTIARDLDNIFSLFPILHERRHMPAGNLSGGEAQMLSIGRALMSSPKLLLLDEPSMGLAPKTVNEIMKVINKLRDRGATILLVEQNAAKAPIAACTYK